MKPRTPEETYGPALDRARASLASQAPGPAAVRAGAVYVPIDAAHGTFDIPFLGAIHHVDWPGGAVRRAVGEGGVDVSVQILLLHYLLTADGAPMASRWIAFRNLPGGLGYDTAYQKRADGRIAEAFGRDKEGFLKAGSVLGGERLSFGDASFSFRLLPCVWLAVVLHLADEEFAAQASILFDAAAPHFLATEDLAVLGGLLAGRLVKAARSRSPEGLLP